MPAIILLQLDVLLANSARPQSVLLNLLREHLNSDKVDLSKLTEPPPGKNLRETVQKKINLDCILLISKQTFKVKDAVVAITKAEGVVHLRVLVMKEKETVMVLVMEVAMMAIEVVEETLSVEATTARSLELTITRRMIVVRNLPSQRAL